jgi:hypothetical protein
MIFGRCLEMCRYDITPFSMPETEHVEMLTCCNVSDGYKMLP